MKASRRDLKLMAGFGFEAGLIDLKLQHRKTTRHDLSLPHSLTHSTISSTQAIGNVAGSAFVSPNATRIEFPSWWSRSDWQRCAQTSEHKSLQRVSCLGTREIILTDRNCLTAVNDVGVRRSNVLAESRALLVKRDAFIAILTSRTRRYSSLAS